LATVDTLSSLLAAAGRAHERYETEELGSPDPDWPGWYADWLIANGIDDLLRMRISQADLREQLIAADKAHRANQPDADWPSTYAALFLKRDV
jgi:hypothetical protein